MLWFNENFWIFLQGSNKIIIFQGNQQAAEELFNMSSPEVLMGNFSTKYF